MSSKCAWTLHEYQINMQNKGLYTINSLWNCFTDVCNKSATLDCSLQHGIFNNTPIWSWLRWEFLMKYFGSHCASWCLMISLRGTGEDRVKWLLDYALMTILDQLLTRRFSLVNWITYKTESHSAHDFGFIQSIRRWWTWDEWADWDSCLYHC